jgi:hypothetical protein
MTDLLVREFWIEPHLTRPENGGSYMPRTFYSTRIVAVPTEAPRPLRPVTQEQSKEWAHECGGVMPFGMPVNIARAADRRRERLMTLVGGIGIAAGIVVIAIAMLWAVNLLVRTLWGG